MSHKPGQLAGPASFGSEAPKRQKKSTPKGIDPAYPNKNFVKACYDNHNDREGFEDYMYGPRGTWDKKGNYIPPDLSKKASGYGHSIGQRAGKLRTSGHPSAHRIGKRSK